MINTNDTQTPIILTSVGVVLSLIVFIFIFNRIEVIKDLPNKKIIYRRKNIYGCRKSEAVFNEKIHFYTCYYITESGVEEVTEVRDDYFFIINDFKDINLDLNIVKQKPIHLFSYYIGMENTKNVIKLNQFVGSPFNFDNPLIFDIKKYMEKNQPESNPIPTFGANKQLSRIMKFSEHLFTYYVRLPHEEKDKKIDMGRSRIDFIFSQNYDEIFIGIVKSNKISYEKTYQYKMNLIDKFSVNMTNNTNSTKDIYLDIYFKNTTNSDRICNIKNILEIDANGIVYLLNEKLNLFNGNTNNNTGDTPNY